METQNQPESNSRPPYEDRERKSRPWSMGVPLIALACALGALLFFLFREASQNRQLATANQSLSDSLARTQTQMQSMAQQLNELRAAQAEAASTARAGQRRRAPALAAGAGSPASRLAVRDDSRFQQIQDRLSLQQNQLADQQKQIATARDDIGKTRDDLQGAITTTHDELSGSIAKTHEEVVALQKLGERNYYEFDLSKDKQFRKVGPLSLSLRKANSKRKSYDMALLVDDDQLQKKNVSLYETVWINLGDRPQPLELVVNKISKDRIQGYLSEPKFKRSELAAPVALNPAKP